MMLSSLLVFKVEWFRDRLELSESDVRKMMLRFPNILSYNFENNIEPTLAWLQHGLGLEPTIARRIVVRAPRLLSSNLDDNLRKKVRFGKVWHLRGRRVKAVNAERRMVECTYIRAAAVNILRCCSCL